VLAIPSELLVRVTQAADNVTMRNALLVMLWTWAMPVWARFEDLYGDEEASYAGKFDSATQMLIYSALVLAVWWWSLEGSRLRWPVGLALLSAPVWYFVLPEVLVLLTFSPLLYYWVRSWFVKKK
jgi:hypothetical protein